MIRGFLGIFVLTSLAVLPSGAIAAPVAGPHPVNLTFIHMVTPLSGWGSTQSEPVLHTTDGGTTWTDVTPGLLRGRPSSIGGGALSIMSAQTAWLAAPAPSGNEEPTTALIFRTTNGGKNWNSLPPLRLGFSFTGLDTLQFIGASHGWLVVVRGAGMSQISFDIYRTSDGGRNWTHTLGESAGTLGGRNGPGGGLPTCDCGQQYTFVSATSAWAAGCYCGIGPDQELFFHSTDGGHTWQHRGPSLVPGMSRGTTTLGAPTFFGNMKAVLPAMSINRFFALYHTLNGGHAWFHTSSIRLHQRYDPISVVSASHTFVLDGNRQLQTADGGRHWFSRPPRSIARR